MRKSLRHALLPALVLAWTACQDGTGPAACERTDWEAGVCPSLVVVSVEVTPADVVFTEIGETQLLEARPADADGLRVTEAAVTWSSSDPGVVAVDGSGLVTAVGDGTATITARVQGVGGDATVTVCTAEIQVNVVPGAYQEGPAGCPLFIPSGSPGDRYRVAIVRLSAAVAEDAPVATLQTTALGVVASPPSVLAPGPTEAPRFPAAAMARLARATETSRATQAAHVRIREAEARLLRALGPLPPMPPSVLATSGPRAVAPAKQTFLTRTPTETSCSASQPTVTGVLVAQSDHIAIYQDSTQSQSLGNRVTEAQARQVLDFYEAHGHPVIESAFGTVPDRDGNGQVLVLVTPKVSGATAAFVWGGDLLTKSICSASNEMELVYFNVAMFKKLGDEDYQVLETLVHEVKHVVSFDQRVVQGVFSLPPSWMEEGTAEIAGEKASRRAWAAAGGPAETEAVTAQSFGGRFTPESFGIALKLDNARDYLSTRGHALVYGPSSGAPYSVYGSGWHFHRFLGDAYGMAASEPNADALLFRQQTSSSTLPGLAGLPVLTGKSFQALLVEYAAAIMLNGTGGPAPQRAFTTYAFPSAATVPAQGAPGGRYPYPVTGTSSVGFGTGSWSGPVGNGGLSIHDFVSNGTGAGIRVTVDVEDAARVVVARLR
jgi:hypothetical protein